MIQIKFLYFKCSNKFGFNPDKSALAYFSYLTGGSRIFLRGAAINEIFGRINSSICFVGLVLYVCVVSC